MGSMIHALYKKLEAEGKLTKDNPEKMSTDQKLAYIEREKLQDYKDNVAPFEEQILAGANSREMIDQSRTDSAAQANVTSAISKRNQSRYGLNISAAMQRQMDRTNSLGNATAAADATNNAVIGQRERNLGVLTDLINKGRGISTSTSASLGQIAGNEAARDSAYGAAKQQHSAQKRQLAGAGLMALAFMM